MEKTAIQLGEACRWSMFYMLEGEELGRKLLFEMVNYYSVSFG